MHNAEIERKRKNIIFTMKFFNSFDAGFHAYGGLVYSII